MYNILHDLTIKSSPEIIFSAITTSTGLDSWWTLKSSGRPALNEIYALYFSPEYDWKAKVTQIHSNVLFELTMMKADEDWNPTYFGFHIKPNDPNACLVSFYHKNWESTNAHFRRTSYCWANLLYLLKQYCECGHITPFEQRDKS